MTRFNLSKKIVKVDDWISPKIDVTDVQEFIKRRQKIKDEFEVKVIGLVWGLAHNTNFNVKMFNNKFNLIRREARKKSDALMGKELSQ